jgi:amino acid permease
MEHVSGSFISSRSLFRFAAAIFQPEMIEKVNEEGKIIVTLGYTLLLSSALKGT